MNESIDFLRNIDTVSEDDHPSSSGMESPLLRARNLRISLKQWKMFHAVIDADGFFNAADSLNVTQSTISHAVAKLQDQLGLPLLVIKGRKAQITEEGRILLERSRHLIRNAVEIEELAEHLRRGWGPEIRLATDPSFPPELLTRALRTFSPHPQRIRLSVKQATHDQARQALQNNTVDLAISTPIGPGFSGRELIAIELVAVAHPANPLFGLKREITPDELRLQCQVAISGVDDYAATEASYRMAAYSQVWNVSSLDRAISVLRQSTGYAWLPRQQIQHALDDHRLRILPLAGGSRQLRSLSLFSARSMTTDSSTGKFAELLRACCRHAASDAPVPETVALHTDAAGGTGPL